MHKPWWRKTGVEMRIEVEPTKPHKHPRRPRKYFIRLLPNMRTGIMLDVNVGHKVQIVITYLDTNGNPMLTPPTPDSAPTWTNAPSGTDVDVFTPSADGSSAELDADAAGTDTVTATVVVGGTTYTANVAVQIDAAAQQLGGIRLDTTVV